MATTKKLRRFKRLPTGPSGGIQLMLIQSVDQLGNQGDVVEVKRGYAMNYLLPQGLATIATDHHARMIEKHRSRLMELQKEKIGKLKATKQDTKELIKKTEVLGEELKSVDNRLQQIQLELKDLTASVPNIPHETVPTGESENDNVEQRCWGERNDFSFEVFDHVELGEDLGMLDFEQATKLTGSRFVVMTAGLARLHRALIQFMLDLHTQEHGYEETYVPYLVNANSLFGTGQLPKFEQDQFATDTDPRYYLIPTAEVPVTNLYRDEILESTELPVRHVCHTPCFRSEAGSYGKDTRGMIRQHQFEKVELVQVTTPEASAEAQEAILQQAERFVDMYSSQMPISVEYRQTTYRLLL